GILGDPAGNILWLDLVVTIVGVSLFLTPGFFVGAAVAGWREALEPDGSGKRPTPPPLWTRGARPDIRPNAPRTTSARPTAAASPTSYPPSAYARPGSQTPE